MKQEIKDYANFQLEKSRNTLAEAGLLYSNNYFTGAVNRIYYSVFYSVAGLMGLFELSTSKHSGMLSNFNREIANKGLVSKELKDFYVEIFDKRQEGDYRVYKFTGKEVKEWLDMAEDFINAIESLTFKIIKEDETAEKDKKEYLKKKDDGFTLIELVMTILLTGILSIGLYQVVMWGINDYLINEEYLHSNNSMSYAMTVIRRNLENAAKPPTTPISPSGAYYCKLSTSINPATSRNLPIVAANMAGQTTICGGSIPQPVCDEVAFYQNISGTPPSQQLVVFCVNSNILYEEVTDGTGGTTISHPVANNISGISF